MAAKKMSMARESDDIRTKASAVLIGLRSTDDVEAHGTVSDQDLQGLVEAIQRLENELTPGQRQILREILEHAAR